MPRRPFASAVALAAIVPAIAFPSAASAATITGSDRGERLLGTRLADTISALAGRDVVIARLGDDRIDGGAGADLLRGNRGDDTIDGGPGRDFVSGGFDDDTLSGGPGADRIMANQGVDTVDGGDGNDDLWALSRKDVSGPGDVTGDTLDGGAGNDRFHTYDGEADRITCGDGRDRVIADTADVITDATPEQPNGSCERVTRTVPESDADENAAD